MALCKRGRKEKDIADAQEQLENKILIEHFWRIDQWRLWHSIKSPDDALRTALHSPLFARVKKTVS